MGSTIEDQYISSIVKIYLKTYSKFGMKDAELLISLFFSCILIVFKAHSSYVNVFQENPCEDFAIDGCAVDEGMILETISDISGNDCQAVCSLVYKEKCNFFTYD